MSVNSIVTFFSSSLFFFLIVAVIFDKGSFYSSNFYLVVLRHFEIQQSVPGPPRCLIQWRDSVSHSLPIQSFLLFANLPVTKSEMEISMHVVFKVANSFWLRPCLQAGRVTLVLGRVTLVRGLPRHSHSSYFQRRIYKAAPGYPRTRVTLANC